MCICKKMFGNKGNYYNVFKKWLPEEETELDESLKSKLADIYKPASLTFNLEPIGDKVGLFKALTGSGEEFQISFTDTTIK